MLKELIKIANNLDKRGLVKEADVLDNIIKTAIIDLPMHSLAQRAYTAALQTGGGAAAAATGGAATAAATVAAAVVSGALVAWMGYEGYQAAVQSLDIKNENTIKAANNAVATAFASALKRIRTSGEIGDDEKRRRLSVSAQIQRNQSITDNEMFQKMMKEVTPEEWAMAKDTIEDSPLSSSGGSGVEGEKARALFRMFQNNTPPSTPATDVVGVRDLW